MKSNFTYFLLAVALGALHACSKEDEPFTPADLKQEYYPVALGAYIDYQVDSIHFSFSDPIVVVDSVKWLEREEVVDTFTDLTGKLTYQLHRYRRANDLDDWVIQRVWTLCPQNNKIEKSEDEYRYVKMVFPVVEGESWDGLAYINTESEDIQWLIREGKDWTFTYADVDAPLNIDTFTFDSTSAIVHVDDSNKIERDLSYEIYAKHIGMVYKEVQILDKQNVFKDWNEPETGFIVRHRIVGYYKP